MVVMAELEPLTSTNLAADEGHGYRNRRMYPRESPDASKALLDPTWCQGYKTFLSLIYKFCAKLECLLD